MSNNPFEDAIKAWADPKNFKPNWDEWLDAWRTNSEAASEVSQAAAENFQAIARRQTEVLQKQAESSLKLVKELVASANSPEATVSKQADFAKNSLESSLANLKELAEMTSKSNMEVYDLANKRLKKALADFDKLSRTASAATDSSSKPKKAA